jgi:hypothetical protein
MNSAGHIEAYCYLNNEWHVAAEWSSSDLDGNGLTRTLIAYNKDLSKKSMINGALAAHTWAGTSYFAPDIIEDDPLSIAIEPMQAVITILDIDVAWAYTAEHFMFELLQQPYAYPDRKLTRGEVAKLICNYLGTVPMRNEKNFLDVELFHPYSRYIWAMNKLGIMTGDGAGHFNPDSELSMQEFAVMAMRMLEYGGEKIAENELEQIQIIENDPENWPPDSSYTQQVLARSREEMDWRARLARGSYQNPIVFADNDKIASWAKASIDEFSKLKILQGDSSGADSRLNPTEPLSKTRFLVFLYKIDQKLPLTVGGLIF